MFVFFNAKYAGKCTNWNHKKLLLRTFCSESFIIRSNGGHICPICRLTMPKEIELQLFRMHVDSHYDQKCPMCDMKFKVEQQRDFERHVNLHFSE